MTCRNDHLEYDWFHRPLPRNVELGPNVYIESSYVFAAFHSEAPRALVMGEGSGAYDLTSLATGPAGRIEIGSYTCLNSSNLEAQSSISIGDHCLLSWGVTVTDSRIPDSAGLASRRSALAETSGDPLRRLRPVSATAPVRIGDNVWIGFDSVVCGGLTIGRGAIIGCKTLVTAEVPAYAIVVGNPARILRFLEPDDTAEARTAALRAFGLYTSAEISH